MTKEKHISQESNKKNSLPKNIAQKDKYFAQSTLAYELL